MEVAVRAGGPFLALLGFTVMPLLWSLPEAAMTAELSVAFPEVKHMFCHLVQRERASCERNAIEVLLLF